MNTISIEVPEGIGRSYLAATPARRMAGLFALINALDPRSKDDLALDFDRAALSMAESLESAGVTPEELQTELGFHIP